MPERVKLSSERWRNALYRGFLPSAQILSNIEPVPLRVQDGKQIYDITIPFPGINSTYAPVPPAPARIDPAEWAARQGA